MSQHSRTPVSGSLCGLLPGRIRLASMVLLLFFVAIYRRFSSEIRLLSQNIGECWIAPDGEACTYEFADTSLNLRVVYASGSRHRSCGTGSANNTTEERRVLSILSSRIRRIEAASKSLRNQGTTLHQTPFGHSFRCTYANKIILSSRITKRNIRVCFLEVYFPFFDNIGVRPEIDENIGPSKSCATLHV